MATRKPTAPAVNTPDYLVKPKGQVEIDITERIKIGESLLSTQLTNQAEYSNLYKEYRDWDDYNQEFLNRVFDKKDNQYYKEYTYSPSMFMGITRIGEARRQPTFQEVAAGLKGDISKYLDRLIKIKNKLVLIDEIPGLQSTQGGEKISKQAEALRNLSNLFSRFHKVAQSLRHRHSDRETLLIKDEYDVQDLLGSLLRIDFDDIRPEDYVPSYAGGNSRVDFTLKQEKIVIEVKMTNDHLRDKDIGSQLLIDIGRYHNHPDCEFLVVFVYDRLDNIRNKPGLITDLENRSTPTLKVKVFISPM